MKKNLIIMLIVLFTFSLTFIACNGDPDVADPALNGTWINKNGDKINFNNGNITFYKGEALETGTFTTDRNKITYVTQITQFDYFERGSLLTKEEVLDILAQMTPGVEISAGELEKVNTAFRFNTTTKTYFIDGNKLYFFDENGEGELMSTFQTYTYTEKL